MQAVSRPDVSRHMTEGRRPAASGRGRTAFGKTLSDAGASRSPTVQRMPVVNPVVPVAVVPVPVVPTALVPVPLVLRPVVPIPVVVRPVVPMVPVVPVRPLVPVTVELPGIVPSTVPVVAPGRRWCRRSRSRRWYPSPP